jgi:hypothetical protein
MSSSKKLAAVLKDLIKVLNDEKRVLIKSDAAALDGLVEKKNDLIVKIQEFRGEDFSGDEEIRKMVSQIDALQETNMLLTKQALSYQKQILKALAKNNTSKYNTYSSNGHLYGQKEVSIVDKSV